MTRIKALFFSLFVVLGFGLGCFLILGCTPERKRASDFYCATPAGIQHFTSPQARAVHKNGMWFVLITNPGTEEEVEIPFTSCLAVHHPE